MSEPCGEDCICFYRRQAFQGAVEKYCIDDNMEPGCIALKFPANSVHNFTDQEAEVFMTSDCTSRSFFIPPHNSLPVLPGLARSFRLVED